MIDLGLPDLEGNVLPQPSPELEAEAVEWANEHINSSDPKEREQAKLILGRFGGN